MAAYTVSCCLAKRPSQDFQKYLLAEELGYILNCISYSLGMSKDFVFMYAVSQNGNYEIITQQCISIHIIQNHHLKSMLKHRFQGENEEPAFLTTFQRCCCWSREHVVISPVYRAHVSSNQKHKHHASYKRQYRKCSQDSGTLNF